MTSGGEAFLFWMLGPISVIGALGLLFAKKAVHAALGVALVMINLGIFYIAQDAEFLGVVQIFVYTGAVMMLFLFVLMLVGVDSSDSLVETIKGQRWVGPAARRSAWASCSSAAVGGVTFGPPVGLTQANAGGNVTGVANLIFGKYVWAFEVTSALLITAALGAMVLAHRERLDPKAQPARVVRAAVPRRRSTSPACRRPASTPGTTRSTPRRCCRTARPASCRSRGCSPPVTQNVGARAATRTPSAAIERRDRGGAGQR